MKKERLKIKKGLVVNRESIYLEFKENFHKSQREYIKQICAFANNKGGEIIFGVKDKPREAVGLNKKYDSFNDYDPKELATQMQNSLSENVEFSFEEFSQKVEGKSIIFGVLKIEESNIKPVICKIADDTKKLREGAIYYRYSGKNEEIKSTDLMNLIQREKDKEKKLFLEHIEKIAKIGVENAGIYSYDGEIFSGEKRILIDKKTLKQLKFIKEGKFVEKNGDPTLVLKGEIKNIKQGEIVTIKSDPNETHPYEGLSKVTDEIKKNNKIKKLLIEIIEKNGKIKKDYINIPKLNKSYSLKYLVSKIKKEKKLDESVEYCWHNDKKTVVKYNNNFIIKCLEYLANQDKLIKILQ